MANDPTFASAFACLEKEWQIDSVQVDTVEQFVCSVYRWHDSIRHLLILDIDYSWNNSI